MLSPTGSAGFNHPLGEVGAAVAVNRSGLISFVATASTYSVEEVAARSTTPPWFQLIPAGDRDVILPMLDRVARLDYPGLCVTIDTPVVGRRESDYALCNPRLAFTDTPETVLYPGRLR